MNTEEIKKKIDELEKRTNTVVKKKAAFDGQLQAKKEELAALVTEIKAAGYDPKTLVSERDRAQTELLSMIEQYEKDLTKAEDALALFDKR